MLLSFEEEIFETVFAEPSARLPGRAANEEALLPQARSLIRNLDTGEVRRLEFKALTKSFVGQEADPKLLGRSPRKPWQGWYAEKQRKEARLWHAVETADTAALREVLAPSTDGSPAVSANSLAAGGRTPLHAAAASGSAEVVQVLHSAGAFVDARTDAGLTPLHFACQRGQREAVRALLKAGADRTVESSKGEMPLHLAAAGGHVDLIAPLLSRNGPTQLQARNDLGQRPVEAAADVRTSLLLNDAWPQKDSYSTRTAFAGLLLRNSRTDSVRRLLQRTQLAPEYMDSPWPSPKAQSQSSASSRARAPFARVKSSATKAERVGPNSFELVKLLGRGSFGEVFQVKRKSTDEVYAMKVLQKSRVLSSNLLRYAMTERNILAYVRHPYIVCLHYAFQTSSHLVLVLQFCPQGNLQQLLARERQLQEPLARLYTAEILLALCHLHERKTIFRDLKPDNIVMDEKSHAMLTDFGLSKEAVAGMRGARSFVGSVAFLAPEILLKRGHGHTVDIYNLGVLLFDMLTGLPPFYHPDRETLFANIKHMPLLVPGHVSSPCRAFIHATMDREPSRRLGAANTAEVQRHSFFSGLDFAALLRREVPVPATWHDEEPALPQRSPESPFGRADRAAGWLARCARGKDDTKRAVSGWEFAAVSVTAQ